MCVLSMVYDAARTVPYEQWTRPALDEFKEIIRRLEELDRKLEQPDCHDPEKAEWMKEIERRLDALELEERRAHGRLI